MRRRFLVASPLTPVINIDVEGQLAMADDTEHSVKMTKSPQHDPITPEHIELVVRQMEMSAREMVGYIAKLDRFERRMLAHASKAASRMVGTVRRADAVIEALEGRQQMLAQLCDQIGGIEDLAMGGGALPPRDEVDTTEQDVGVGLDILAAQLEHLAGELSRQKEQGSIDIADLSGGLLRLQAGMDALEQAASAKDAA